MCRPYHSFEILLLWPLLGLFAGMLGIIVLLEDGIRGIGAIILHGLLELILQNLKIKVSIHPTINLGSKANSLPSHICYSTDGPLSFSSTRDPAYDPQTSPLEGTA